MVEGVGVPSGVVWSCGARGGVASMSKEIDSYYFNPKSDLQESAPPDQHEVCTAFLSNWTLHSLTQP